MYSNRVTPQSTEDLAWYIVVKVPDARGKKRRGTGLLVLTATIWTIIDSSRSKNFLFLLMIYDITWSTATGYLRTGMDAWDANGIIMRLRAAVRRERVDKRDRLLLYALVSKASHMTLLGNSHT